MTNSRDSLDNVFGIKSQPYHPTFIKLSSKEARDCVPLTSRGGSLARYPWTDPSYNEGDSFFKPMSKEELDNAKGRPSPSPTVKAMGYKWRSKSVFNNKTKQYGYQVTLVHRPQSSTVLYQ